MLIYQALSAFEAWDPNMGMVVIVNAGAVLSVRKLVFDQPIGPGKPPAGRAVEFEILGRRYYSPFDRFHDNTKQHQPSISGHSEAG